MTLIKILFFSKIEILEFFPFSILQFGFIQYMRLVPKFKQKDPLSEFVTELQLTPVGCQLVRCLNLEPTVTAWFNSIMKYRSNNFYLNMIFQSWPGTTMALQHNIGFMILIILIPLPLDGRKYSVAKKHKRSNTQGNSSVVS